MSRSITLLGLILSSLFLCSCGKKEFSNLEVYISSKKSDLYQSVKVEIWNIRIPHQSGGTSLVSVPNSSDNIEFKEGDSTFLIKNVSFLEGEYLQIGLSLTDMVATSQDSTYQIIRSNKIETLMHDFEFELLPNKNYRIDIKYDLDNAIRISENIQFDNFFDSNIHPEITFEEI